MDTKLIKAVENIRDLVKNIHLNVTVEGWPAVATVISLCGTGIVLYAIKVTHSE